MQELKRRLRKLDELEGRINSIIIINSGDNPNFFYFANSGVNGIFYYDFEKPKIFTSEMELTRAKKSWISNAEAIKSMKEIFSKAKGKTGIDAKNTPADKFRKIKSKKVDISDFLENIRAVKTDYEKQCITKACMIASKIYVKIEKEWKGLTELEMKGLIEFMMHKNGVTPSFPTIVASGTNVIYPHHEPTIKKIKEPVIIDMGVRYNGYCSDITRTIGSDFDNIIEKVFDEIEQELEPGKRAADLDKKARSVLGKHSKYFIHGLGHGIGLEVHEKPAISGKSRDILKANMTFTIEPGIYRRKGIRHEEDYLLTEKSFRKLT